MPTVSPVARKLLVTLIFLFTPFYTDKNRGTGLGLAIAKNIIEEHNGSIAVESETGKGATFIITLTQQ